MKHLTMNSGLADGKDTQKESVLTHYIKAGIRMNNRFFRNRSRNNVFKLILMSTVLVLLALNLIGRKSETESSHAGMQCQLPIATETNKAEPVAVGTASEQTGPSSWRGTVKILEVLIVIILVMIFIRMEKKKKVALS